MASSAWYGMGRKGSTAADTLRGSKRALARPGCPFAIRGRTAYRITDFETQVDRGMTT